MAAASSALRVGGKLSAELLRPEAATALVILAHGAGADFRHASMLGIAEAFAAQDLATLRFNFPFMEQGRRRVDAQSVSVASIVEATVTAAEAAGDLPLYLGGHSYGGRMASHAMAEGSLPVRGLIFCSFPLHPPNKPGTGRADHLDAVQAPMLFLSGTRDALAEPALLTGVVERLAPRAELHWLDTADHSYRILKRRRTSQVSVFEEMAATAAEFVARGNLHPR